MSKKCADCGCEVNRNVIQGMYYCPRCDDDKREIDVLPMTLFDRITESPEVLAEKLVYQTAERVRRYVYRTDGACVGWNYDVSVGVWKSTVTEGTYSDEAEAIAATVAKLKEVVE